MSTSGFNNTITGNTIGFASAAGSGVTSISGSTNVFVGLNLSSGSTTVATSVQGNTISGIVQRHGQHRHRQRIRLPRHLPGEWAASMLEPLLATTIGSLTGASTITFTESSTGAFAGIYDFSSSSNPISNNRIGAITINGTGTGTGGFRGILLNTSSVATATLNDNQIGGSRAGAITDTLVGAYAMYGIQNGLANLSATGNTIRNIAGNSNAAATIVVQRHGFDRNRSRGSKHSFPKTLFIL